MEPESTSSWKAALVILQIAAIVFGIGLGVWLINTMAA